MVALSSWVRSARGERLANILIVSRIGVTDVVGDQADFETLRTVVDAFAACHADARSGGRRLGLVYFFGIALTGSDTLGRSQTESRVSMRVVPASNRFSTSSCACVQARSLDFLRVCCRCFGAVGWDRSACRGCARQSGCDNHALMTERRWSRD